MDLNGFNILRFATNYLVNANGEVYNRRIGKMVSNAAIVRNNTRYLSVEINTKTRESIPLGYLVLVGLTGNPPSRVRSFTFNNCDPLDVRLDNLSWSNRKPDNIKYFQFTNYIDVGYVVHDEEKSVKFTRSNAYTNIIVTDLETGNKYEAVSIKHASHITGICNNHLGAELAVNGVCITPKYHIKGVKNAKCTKNDDDD
jgi:hypothetical protein